MSNGYEEWRNTDEMEAIYTMPEADEAIKATIITMGPVGPENPILLACSDDRAPSAESLDDLSAQGLPGERPYLKLFGGKYGAANILLTAATLQHGMEHTKAILGGNYLGVAEDLAERAKRLGVIMAAHSDETAEGKAAGLNPDANSKLACAKAAGLGAINNISVHEQLAIRTGETDSEALLGDAFEAEQYKEIPKAVAEVGFEYFGHQPAEFSVTREDVLSTKTPSITLKDKHAPSANVKHVFNLEPDKVSDSKEAIARAVYYYHTDLVPVAEILMKAYPELKLDPKILMQTIILDAASTRMALANIDGEADPSRLEAVRYGNSGSALDYLYGVSESLS